MEEVDVSKLSNNALVARARETYARFQEVPRWSNENVGLLVIWGDVCAELSRRRIHDPVTYAMVTEP